MFKQNHDDFYVEHFEYEKIFELIRRKSWWFDLIRNVKKYFKFGIDCHRIKFTKHKFYDFLKFLSMSKNFRQDWILNVIIDFFSCRILNEIYDSILMIVNRFTKYAIYILVRKNWKIKNLANALTNNVFKYFDMLISIVNDKKSLFVLHFLSTFYYYCSMTLRYNIVFHSQTNNLTKRQNQILEQYLKCYVNYQQSNWATLLWIAMCTYNNT